MAHTAAILGHEVAQLQQANDTLSKRKSRKRKRVQKEGILSFNKGERLAVSKEFGARKSKEGGGRGRALMEASLLKGAVNSAARQGTTRVHVK